jgi:hypothetical protein
MYVKNPNPIPSEIEYVRIITRIVMKLEIAIGQLFHSILPIEPAIIVPTITIAAAVTPAVIRLNNGAKNTDNKNRIPVTTDAKPVLAPAPIPDNDSIYEVVVEVPSTAPTTVAEESTIFAF